MKFGQPDFYFVCLLETIDGNEKINMLMPEEIIKAEWIPLKQSEDVSTTAESILQVLRPQLIKNNAADLANIPINQIFKETSFTTKEVEILGRQAKIFRS